MSGKPVYDIDFFGRFMQLVDDIGKQAAARGKNAVIHVSDKLSFWFREFRGNFI